MKKVLLFIICGILPLLLNSQVRSDAFYKAQLDTASSNGFTLTILDTLLSRAFQVDNDAFIDYSKQYIELALDLDSIEPAARKAMRLQLILTSYANDPLQSITLLNNVLARKYKIKDSSLLGGLYIRRGRAKTRVNLRNAVEDYNIALKNYSKQDTLQIADVYLFRGQAYSSLGRFVLAIEDFNKAYSMYERAEAYDYMMFSKQGIINMFSMNGFYEKAKAERELLIKKMKSLDLISYLPNEYYNQALDYKKMGLPKLEYQAIQEAQNSWPDYKSDKPLLIRIHSLLAENYTENFELDKAQEEMELIEGQEYDFSKDPYTELNYLSAKIKYLRVTGETEEALKLSNKKLQVAQNLGLEDEIMTSYSLLSEINYDLQQYKKSIDYRTIYATIKDSIYNRSALNALAYYQSLYEIEKKEKELVESTTNIALLKKDSENFKKIIIFSGIAVLLAFILFILYRNQRYLKSKKILQEKFSQELLFSQEKERRRIAKDLHDGIGQQLLVIKNKLNQVEDEETKKLVNVVIEEVRMISRDLYPFQLQEMGLTQAIEHTIKLVDENTKLFISAEIDNIDNIFSKEKEINIYRIVQESLSNILKHAHAEAAKVSIQKLDTNLLISIRDNGVGFEFAEKYNDRKSLGLKVLMERTKLLNGQMKVTSKRNAGTVLEFNFPL